MTDRAMEAARQGVHAYKSGDPEAKREWRIKGVRRGVEEEMADEESDYWERQQFGRWDLDD